MGQDKALKLSLLAETIKKSELSNFVDYRFSDARAEADPFFDGLIAEIKEATSAYNKSLEAVIDKLISHLAQ